MREKCTEKMGPVLNTGTINKVKKRKKSKKSKSAKLSYRNIWYDYCNRNIESKYSRYKHNRHYVK